MPHIIGPQTAFRNAISEGVLSDRSGEPNYAGRFMYMYSTDGEHGFPTDFFKHRVTRRYVACEHIPYVTIR